MKEKVQKLEDLKAWQEGKLLAVAVYKITLTEIWLKDYSLRDQIRRSSVSVPSNIAEGYGRSGNKEFIRYLYIAKGSLYELKTQLLIANEIGYLSELDLKNTGEQIDKVAKIISGLLHYLKETEYKGSKFAEPEIEYGISTNLEATTSNFEPRTSN